MSGLLVAVLLVPFVTAGVTLFTGHRSDVAAKGISVGGSALGLLLTGVLARRNAVLVLMGVELMLHAVNLNFVAFDAQLRDVLHGGQTFALFVIVIAAAEIGLALAIVLLVFRTHGHIDVDELRELADREATR